LVLALPVAAALAAGLPFGGWRSPIEVAQSTDPFALLPGLHPGLGPLSVTIRYWAIAAALGAATGALTWLWRGGAAGFGFFAACAAFSLSLLIEVVRWFKPGQLPDLHDPLIAALVAPLIWRILRFLPTQPVTPLPRHGPWRTRWRVLSRFILMGCLLGLLAATAGAVPGVLNLGLTPVQIAVQVTRLPEGRTSTSGVVTRIIASAFDRIGLGPWLQAANRIDRSNDLALPDWSGAGTSHDGVLPDGRLRPVTSIETLRQAIDSAAPGDVILLQPGVYRIAKSYVTVARPGTADAPITLRAPRLGSVTLESELPEAFKVDAPYWQFENLVLKGVCADDGACDNGIHIVGRAEHTVIHNLRIEDFNAQIKINGENGQFPDDGRIAQTTLIDTHARRTDAPVTPIDLVAANRWAIEDNLIADFVKIGGNHVSYGAYAKGAAHGTVFTRNVVLCEWRLHDPVNLAIGLSFGGGGTGLSFTRDQGRSGYEHADGAMTDNLIAFCSDDGIYLNRAANNVIRHNTLIATSGIDVRYPESIADVEANLVDGPIRARDDGLFWEDGNESGSLAGMFLGRNPVRAFFTDAARLDLRWRHLPTLVGTEPGVDLCGADWTALSPAGAFRDFRACGGVEKP
jgi:parallel beta-helix repeat protein